ncbi:MAG: hypothetical protein LBM18_03425 [Oscillospiraceae bacterium]|jgi:hypothetical protein|nr:hypothetical protein [Oscillospiraceae bacterium]
MKKLLTLTLALVLVLSLTACGSEMGGTAKTPISVETDSQTSNEESSPPETQNSAETPTINTAEPSVSEQILVEQDGIRITLTGAEDTWLGLEWKLLVENNSDKSVTVQTRDVTVNGLMVDTMCSIDVAAGKKANDAVTFMSSDFEALNISVMKDVTIKFHVFDSDTWDTIFDSESISVSVNEGIEYTQTYDDSGIEVLNQNGFRIVAKRIDDVESFWGADLYLYIENNSGIDATIQVREVSINGFMVSPIFSSDILNSAKAFDEISFLSDELESNNITSIDTVELSFHIFDKEAWDTIMDTEAITINF